jgi:hypothetical protein
MNFHRFWIGERMGPWGWIGAGCILAGILMAEAVKRAQGKEQGAQSIELYYLLLTTCRFSAAGAWKRKPAPEPEDW